MTATQLLRIAFSQVPGLLKHAPDRLARLRHVVVNVVSLVIVLGATVLVGFEMSRPRVTVELIEVPEQLLRRGYTPRVAAQRLIEQLRDIRDRAGSVGTNAGVLEAEWSRPDFVVPDAGLSLKTTVAYLRGVFQQRTNTVTGELVYTEPGQHLLNLRLRVDGKSVGIAHGTDTGDHIEEIFADGARKLARVVEPYILAAYYFSEQDQSGFASLISYISAHHAGTMQEVRAFNLQALNHQREGRLRDAINGYKAAIARNPHFALPYLNWGTALAETGEYDEAILKLKIAIALSPDMAAAYVGWGTSLTFQGQSNYEAAIRRLRKAMGWWSTALTLHEPSNYEAAIRRFRKAIDLDPQSAPAYTGWGVALGFQRKYDEAVLMFRRASAVDPTYAKAYHGWGEALRDGDPANYKGAIEKYEIAIDIEPDMVGVLAPELGVAYARWGCALTAQYPPYYASAVPKFKKAIDLDPNNNDYKAFASIPGSPGDTASLQVFQGLSVVKELCGKIMQRGSQ